MSGKKRKVVLVHTETRTSQHFIEMKNYRVKQCLWEIERNVMLNILLMEGFLF